LHVASVYKTRLLVRATFTTVEGFCFLANNKMKKAIRFFNLMAFMLDWQLIDFIH